MAKYQSHKTITNALLNILIVFFLYSVCRLEFYAENLDMFSTSAFSTDFLQILIGGLRFDASAICYTNGLYILLLFFPLHFKEKPIFHKIAKYIFVIVNSCCIVLNLIDSVYFKYSTHRTTVSTFNEFSEEGNLLQILGMETIWHWYLFLLFVLMVYILIKCYRPTFSHQNKLWCYYIQQVFLLALLTAVTVMGMRGNGWQKATRPITISNAYQYVNNTNETNIVLNTPFSLLRTSNRKSPKVPTFFQNQKELDRVYTPVHIPDTTILPNKKNIVILIIEDLSKEFIGSLNPALENGEYKGYTPFLDSLLTVSLSYDNTFSNGVTSIDGMPAVLASIPHGQDPFILSTYSLNKINSIATELKNWDYTTAFFHGAMNGSMGFDAFANQAGFDLYYGKTEYNKDSRFGGENDFDGTWAIWDEEFLQYYALTMSELKEPFVTAVFTATSHHPYALPARYKDTFKDEGNNPVHKCIRYTDFSIKRFFETAKTQKWYDNSIFVITADHANPICSHEEYKVGIGHCKVPIIIYDPSQEIKPERRHGIMQQIDIMPSLLHHIGYDKPFVAFGRNIFSDKNTEGWATNWHAVPQYMYKNYYMEMELNGNILSLYDYVNDPLFKENLANKGLSIKDSIKHAFKAYLQSYFMRMENNDLTIETTHPNTQR